jgi:hypothetical protein
LPFSYISSNKKRVLVNFSGLAGEEAMLQDLANRVPASFLELNRKALVMGFELGRNSKKSI